MIEDYWGLRRKPFANTPDPAFFVRLPDVDEAFARLLYDVTEVRGGLSLVTGDIGCGKTMLAHALVDRLAGTPCEATVLHSPRLTPVQLLQAVLHAAGGTRAPRGKHPLVQALAAHLKQQHAAGRRPVFVVDEAQLATPTLLEEVRLLTNFEDRSDKHVHVVLVGQPELRARIATLPQINQRVGLRAHLVPLELADVETYVAQRLRVAGANGRPIFAAEALAALAARSGGVPRLINNIATQALFVAAARGERVVGAGLVDDVADDRE
ncbi:MAG: AAA family ATPase [Gemmatimonadetes bacterium]|nr:AAA family ATPase [Gemmatimonadota bacterium]